MSSSASSIGWAGCSLVISGQLAAGGMGEVYRARDQKLGRDVAIKVLPAAFTADAERLARFAREARVLAALNHPKIARSRTQEGNASMPGPRARGGRDAAARIGRGPKPVQAALRIARQIADALERRIRKASSTAI